MAFEEHYAAIKAIAHRELARHQRNSINTTALVHEAYLKLAGASTPLQSDRHQMNLVATAMRQILVDAARARVANKRGGDWARVTLDGNAIGADQPLDVLLLDDTLTALHNANPRLAKVFELHFFSGADLSEIATELNITVRTAQRDWQAARVLIATQLRD